LINFFLLKNFFYSSCRFIKISRLINLNKIIFVHIASQKLPFHWWFMRDRAYQIHHMRHKLFRIFFIFVLVLFIRSLNTFSPGRMSASESAKKKFWRWKICFRVHVAQLSCVCLNNWHGIFFSLTPQKLFFCCVVPADGGWLFENWQTCHVWLMLDGDFNFFLRAKIINGERGA
jgi:hypothetical protein